MPPAIGSNRSRNRLTSERFSIFRVAVVVLSHGDRDREQHARRSEIGINLDLGGCVAFAQRVENVVDVRPEPLVGLPWDSSRNDEVSLGPPKVFSHTQ